MRKPVVLGALLGLVLLAGCSGESGSSDSVAGPARIAAPAANAQADSAGTGGSATTDKGASTTALVETRQLIRIANLAVGVDRGTVNQQAVRADNVATDAGGTVFSDDRTTEAAQLTLKVPPAALASVLTKLADLGDEQSRSLSTEDVTQRVADVDARVASAEATLARLRTLYDRATKVSDVLSIESELSSREADLESLQAQQRVLNSQTAQATVHLELTAATAPPPAKRHGVGGALASGWDAFTSSAAGVTRALATSLPFLAVLAIIAAGGWQVWRRRVRVAPPAAASDPT